MPLWVVYHPPGTFDDDETKQALAKDITDWYSTGRGTLPRFYVVVNFIQLPVNSVWVGGELRKDKPFIRLTVDHIAVRMPDDDAQYKRIMQGISAFLKPHIADKGYDWEVHVDETERRLWQINGINPPPWRSEEEKMWHKENRPVPYETKL